MKTLIISILALVVGTTGVRAQATGAIVGRVVDVTTGDPVEFAQILLEEASRSAGADQDGRFELSFIQADSYTLKAYRVGYEPLIQSIRVPIQDTLRLTLHMTATPLEQGEVIVEGNRERATQLADAAMNIEGRKLRQNLGTTIAETLEDEPGIAMRSMGPAPARPVLRGLGGERLLVLEDGGRTGDLSATSTDHAVVIDPLTSERIEIIRGPAALVYGSNTLGGVINVVRGTIPSGRVQHSNVGVGLQAQSVNSGFSGGFGAEAPLGLFAVHLDGSVRTAGNVETPVGTLDNTDLTTYNGSLGTGLTGRWGHVGVAGSIYDSRYGIPGGFVGAHPHGVNIELNRRHFAARAELFEPIPLFPRVEIDASFSRYAHKEFEADDILGVEYGLLTYSGRMLLHTHSKGHVWKGAVGIWSEYRDYAAGGFSFTPASTEWTLAGFAFQDVHFDHFTVQAGIRYDVRRVNPRDDTPVDRLLGGVSGSARGMLHLSTDLSVGATVMHSLRMPGIVELYSEGPHLAAYSFEIGSPELDPERGWGGEVFGHYATGRISGSLAVYYNLIRGYIFPRNTGEIDDRTLLPIYQQSGSTARMIGGEASLEVQPHRHVRLSGTASYVRGTLTEWDEPLPWMPPLRGKLEASYTRSPLTFGATTRMANTQERIGPFEDPTEGHVVVGAFAQYHLTTGRLLHTIDLVIDNAFDVEYRDHLSRVKSVMPEPGRNVKLLYKVYI